MKVHDPGHSYLVNKLAGTKESATTEVGVDLISFVKREGEGYPGNVGHHDGTNCQELIRVLIDRLQYLDNQIMDPANIHAIECLRTALLDLEMRAARRHGLRLPRSISREIELLPTCLHCGHIVCAMPVWEWPED